MLAKGNHSQTVTSSGIRSDNLSIVSPKIYSQQFTEIGWIIGVFMLIAYREKLEKHTYRF